MLLHLSDLHFGTEKSECIQAIQQFCAEQKPEAVVVSGDLTQRARYGQFFACKQFLEGLNIPYLVVPGNHDIPLYQVWTRFFNAFGGYQLFFGQLENVLQTEHFYIVGINTIRRRHHTQGSISMQQIQQVDAALRQAPAHKLKLVVAHQPFYAAPNDRHGLKDCPVLARTALDVWSQSGLNALLHGHLHQTAVFDLNQVYQLNAPHPILEIHAGTAMSYRLHRQLPNSFNLIGINGDVVPYRFAAQQGQFIVAQAGPSA